MSYTIKTTNGSTIAIIQDATLNTIATSLTLVGRDYAGYGAFLNENFVYLLENFAANTAPAHQITGQLWYDTSVKTVKVYDSGLATWKSISSSTAKVTNPLNGSIGDLWFKTNTYQLFVYTGDITIGTNGWQLIGPPTTSTSGKTSGAVVETITDSSSNDHMAIKFYIENSVVAIMSYDSTYTPLVSINGFSVINPGFNLVSSDILSGSQITGSTSNALTLNGVTSNKFVRSDVAATAYSITASSGFVVAQDLSLTLDAANNRVAVSAITNDRDLNFYVNHGGSNIAAIAINSSTSTVTISNDAVITGALTSTSSFTANGTTKLVGVTTVQAPILATNDGQQELGNTKVRFGNVWATSLYGNLIGGLTTAATFTVTGSATLSNTLSTGTFTSNGNIVTNGTVTVNGNIFVANTYVPASNTSPGTKGQITWTSGYFYVCVAANTWARTTLTTSWP